MRAALLWLLSGAAFAAVAAAPAKCAYKTPSVEEVVTMVPLVEDGDRDGRSRRQLFPPRQASLDQVYRQLRIKLHFDDSIARYTLSPCPPHARPNGERAGCPCPDGVS